MNRGITVVMYASSPKREVDRSATGSGVSARAAVHHAKGELALNEGIHDRKYSWQHHDRTGSGADAVRHPQCCDTGGQRVGFRVEQGVLLRSQRSFQEWLHLPLIPPLLDIVTTERGQPEDNRELRCRISSNKISSSPLSSRSGVGGSSPHFRNFLK